MAKKKAKPKKAINRNQPVVISGAEEMAQALRDAGPETRQQVRRVQQKIGKLAEGWAKKEAKAGLPMQRAAAPSIIGGSNNAYAFIRVRKNSKIPFALAAFWGVLGRRGWYAADRYKGSGARQFPAWVGNKGWQWGGPGGPYAVNDALRKNKDEIARIYDDAVRDAFTASGLA